MVLTIEPRFVSSLEGSLQWKITEVTMRASLDAYTTNNLPISLTRLIFQEKVMLEEGGLVGNGKITLTKVHEDGDLHNRVWIEMDQLDLVVVMEVAEEIIGRKPKFMLKEGGQHHNLTGVRCGNVFIFGWPPLDYDTVRKVFPCALKEFPFIDEGGLEQLRVRGGHGTGKGDLGKETRVQGRMATTEGSLGFSLGPLIYRLQR
jgi:hypothetical protein